MTHCYMPFPARPLRPWQRWHANAVVAEVSPIEGMGTWRACVKATEKGDVRKDAGWFMVDAHAAVDALARTYDGHVCDDRCGEWHPVDRRVA